MRAPYRTGCGYRPGCLPRGGGRAAPQPAISQVQAQVNALRAKIDQIGQQYDQATGLLASADPAVILGRAALD